MAERRPGTRDTVEADRAAAAADRAAAGRAAAGRVGAGRAAAGRVGAGRAAADWAAADRVAADRAAADRVGLRRVDGARLFVRYAYPPNERGYCGPDASDELLERAGSPHGADDGLRRLARGFEGAWPYLELIAAANGLGDPLDARVVEAYWIGNGLLHAPSSLLGRSLEDRFRGRLGRRWDGLAAAVPGASPHHSFHVFGVYPWLGLLREGQVDAPLQVLDGCRIRWGRVVEVTGGTATVRSRPLVWDGRELREGAPRLEVVTVQRDGRGLSGDRLSGDGLSGQPAAGDWCSMHWGWVCERLDLRRLRALQWWSARELALVNGAPVAAPAVVLS